MDKRKVARWFLSDLPNRTKEGLCVIGCAASCGMAAYDYFSNANLSVAAYVTLIITLALNELATLWWRIDRFRRLLAIDRARPVSAPA